MKKKIMLCLMLVSCLVFNPVVSNATITPRYVTCPATGDKHNYKNYGSSYITKEYRGHGHYVGKTEDGDKIYANCEITKTIRNQPTRCTCGKKGKTKETTVKTEHDFM